MKPELGRTSMKYPEDSKKMNAHVCTFIWGLLGRGDMYLFGCDKNAWKIKFDSKDKFPSKKLNLKHNKQSIVVPVIGCGEILEKE